MGQPWASHGPASSLIIRLPVRLFFSFLYSVYVGSLRFCEEVQHTFSDG